MNFLFVHWTGFGFGNHDDASFNLSQKFKLQPGNNAIDILSMIVGLQV